MIVRLDIWQEFSDHNVSCIDVFHRTLVEESETSCLHNQVQNYNDNVNNFEKWQADRVIVAKV